MKLLFDQYKSPIGLLLLVALEDETLVHLDFEDGMDRLHRLLAKRFSHYSLTTHSLTEIQQSLTRYFNRDMAALQEIKTEMGGSDFQKSVWQALTHIKPGSVKTYQELAHLIGKPRAVRAVASANANNPLSLVYPCHRVIGTDGKLRGYAGGLDRKDWLLRHEKVTPTWT